MKYITFVSYTSREVEVPRIMNFFDHLGKALVTNYNLDLIPVFIDRLYLESRRYDDDELREHLEFALSQSAFTTAFLSPQYFESDWCRYEWNLSGQIPATFPILPVIWKHPVSMPEHQSNSLGFRPFRDEKGRLFSGRPPMGIGPSISLLDSFGYDRSVCHFENSDLYHAARQFYEFVVWTGAIAGGIEVLTEFDRRPFWYRNHPPRPSHFNTEREEEAFWRQNSWSQAR